MNPLRYFELKTLFCDPRMNVSIGGMGREWLITQSRGLSFFLYRVTTGLIQWGNDSSEIFQSPKANSIHRKRSKNEIFGILAIFLHWHQAYIL